MPDIDWYTFVGQTWAETSSFSTNSLTSEMLDDYAARIREQYFGDTPAKKKPKYAKHQLKDWYMDMKDTLWWAFKGQDRILSTRYFTTMLYEGSTRFRWEREQAVFNGSYAIYFNSVMIGKTLRKPHLQLTLTKLKQTSQRPDVLYAQALLLRTTLELFPYCKVKKD